jgi:phosphate transport system protein
MRYLHEELKTLKDSLLEMMELVSGQLKKSVSALMDRDQDLANEVLYTEKRVNAFELKIDSDCEHIFTLLTPVAHDMRFVFSTLKINADLERIGDYADGIAKLVLLALNDFDDKLIEQLEVKRMYEIAYDMLNDIREAYSVEDSTLARTVYTRDQEINRINYAATDVIVKYCEENPLKVAQAIHLLSIVRRLERVGDHITNIAEDIIFHKEAVVMKHNKTKE